MSEERIEPGDRVKLTPSGREGTVVWVDGEHIGVHFDATPEAWQRPVLCTRTLLRLVAKARYEPIEEDLDLADEFREAWEYAHGEPLEDSALRGTTHKWTTCAKVGLVLIEDRNRLSMRARSTFEELTMVRAQARSTQFDARQYEASAHQLRIRVDDAESEIARWRAATGCDTPEEAERLILARLELLDEVRDLKAEVVRLRGELDEARLRLNAVSIDWPLAKELAEKAESEVARLTARAEAAEKDLADERAALHDLCGNAELMVLAVDDPLPDRPVACVAVVDVEAITVPSVVSDETEAGE